MHKIRWKHIALWIVLIGVLVVLFSVASADRVNLGQSGWVKLDDGKYYGDENGYAITGHQQIDDDYYYFDTSGLLRTEWHVVHCTPGSSEEKNALLKGLPYDNGQKRVVGTSITDVNEKADWIIKNYISSGMTEREKASILHNWLIYNAHYDFTYSNYYADGVLITGAGVCDSYTRAYCLLLSKVGIENKRYVGHNGKEGHAWNLVKIDGQWYHVDCTWDDPNDSGTKSYSHCETTKFFLVKDTYIKHFHDFYEEISADSNYVRWVEMNDKTFFYGSDGKRATGMTTIDNCTYFFSDDGIMQKGLQHINGDLYMFSEYTGQMKIDGWYWPYYFGKDGKALTGLQTIDNQTYYFSADGIKQTGWQTINGKYYYFDDIMITGWQTIDDHLYYFTETGALKTGPCWFNDNNITYYITADGTLLTGLQKISGKTYYFLEYHGQMLTGWIYFDDESGYRYFNDKGEMQTGWYTEEDKTYYFQADGFAANGLQTIEGKTYYFDDNGRMVTGWKYFYDELEYRYFNDKGEMQTGWYTEGDKTYYFQADGFAANGLQTIEGKTYYFSADNYGVMQTGWIYFYDELEYRYFNDKGEMQTGWYTEGDITYYFQADGFAANGLQTIEGKTYYFDDNGRMRTGWIYFDDEGGYRYFNDKGEMQTGWYTEGDITYYFQADGFAANGLQTIEGKTYYFDDNERMVTGWNYFSAESGYRYFNDKGEMQTGLYTEGDNTYYFQADGLGVSGLQEVDGILCLFYNAVLQKNTWWTSGDNRYYFDADGKAATGFTVIDGIKYYFNEQHIQQTGWIQLNETEIGYSDLYLGLIVGNDEIIDGAIYRFDENGNLVGRVVYEGYYSPEQILEVKAERDENGNLQVITTGKVLGIPLGWTGWVCQGNTWYYGDENGYALIGLHNIDGIPCCFNEQGELATGWIKANDKWYYADHSGIAAHNGWQQINGIWYYFYADGEMATGWLNDGGTYYYMKSDGSMLTGWVKDKGKWYYLDDNGALKTGWLNDSGNWYYLLSDGQLATGWICEGGVYYYMDKNGLMLTGWIEAGGKWYYMNESGVMQTGWLKSGNSWYYLRSGGELASGWEQIGGQWYYFKKSGAMASNEWIEDKEAEAELPAAQKRALWYWFDGSGKMAAGWKEINGQWEMFSDSGEWLYTWNGN